MRNGRDIVWQKDKGEVHERNETGNRRKQEKNSKAVPKNIDLPLGELRAEEDAPEENWNGSAGKDAEAQEESWNGSTGKDADAQEESCEDNTQLKIDEDAPTQEELEEERAYEARRAARAERLKQRKRRRKRKKSPFWDLPQLRYWFLVPAFTSEMNF